MMNRQSHFISADRLRVRSQGSSLLEALLALVILGFGLLAIGKLQITLADAIGTGRERVEATLIAEEEMDRLRSFDLIDNVAGSPDHAQHLGYNEVVTTSTSQLSSSDYPNYTAQYSRGVTISTNPVTLNTVIPELKLTFVNVTWTNKKGSAQTFSLPSAIAKHDPSDAAWLIACQTDEDIRCGTKDKIKTPYNRNLRIPYPAKDLGGGKSAFAPPGSPTKRIIFDNDTGLIEEICNDVDSNISDDVLSSLTSVYTGCTNINGYLLSGFISGFSTGSRAHDLTATQIQSISVVPTITLGGTTPTCFDDSATHTLLDLDHAISYACIITPTDHDANANTPMVWSGTTLLGFTGVTLGTGNTAVKVCRFSFDSNGDGTISNDEHPATYTNVSGGLENQNFVVIKGTCSSSNKEVLHQTALPT